MVFPKLLCLQLACSSQVIFGYHCAIQTSSSMILTVKRNMGIIMLKVTYGTPILVYFYPQVLIICVFNSWIYSLEGKTHIYTNHVKPKQAVISNTRAKYCQYRWAKRKYSLENEEEGSNIWAEAWRTIHTQGLVRSPFCLA